MKSGPLIQLSGEFREPRPWHIPTGITPTFVNVILSSGGVTEKADLTRVFVSRIVNGEGVLKEVNVANILDGGGLSADVVLVDGDTVIIITDDPEVRPAERIVHPHYLHYDDYLQEILDKFQPVIQPYPNYLKYDDHLQEILDKFRPAIQP